MVEGSGKQRDIGSGRKLIGLEVLLDCLIACAAQDCLFLQWKDLILSFKIKMKKYNIYTCLALESISFADVDYFC